MKCTRHGLAAALLAACFATSAFAAGASEAPPAADQGAPGDHGPGDHGPGDRGPGGPGGPQGFGGHGPGMPGPDMPFEGLHRLDLSEAQQDKLFAIRHAAEPEQREHMKAIRKAHEALAELGRADRFDDARATALSRDLGQAIAAEALLHARVEAQSLAVLTPEQREQMRKHRRPGPQGQAGETDRQGPRERQ